MKFTIYYHTEMPVTGKQVVEADSCEAAEKLGQEYIAQRHKTSFDTSTQPPVIWETFQDDDVDYFNVQVNEVDESDKRDIALSKDIWKINRKFAADKRRRKEADRAAYEGAKRERA